MKLKRMGHIASDCTELAAHHQRLTETGIFVGAIHDHRDGTASFYSKDLDNNLFEFLYEPHTDKLDQTE